MVARSTTALPPVSGWAFEPKFDGGSADASGGPRRPGEVAVLTGTQLDQRVAEIIAAVTDQCHPAQCGTGDCLLEQRQAGLPR
jgi:hypothetical protein